MEMILDRGLYKKIKSMDRATMNSFIQDVYQQGADSTDAKAIDYDALKADLSQIKGIGESRLAEIMEVIDRHMGSVSNEEEQN